MTQQKKQTLQIVIVILLAAILGILVYDQVQKAEEPSHVAAEEMEETVNILQRQLKGGGS
jgi:CHASE3 domain sensor protein